MSIATWLAGAATFLARGLNRQHVYNVRDYGALGDHRVVNDGVMAAGSAVLTSATANFVAPSGGNPGDVGKLIWLAPTDRTTVPRVVADAAISSTVNPNTLTSATIAFVAADVGRWVSIAGAGIGGTVPLIAQITSVSNATTALLTANAQTTVSGASLSVFVLGTSSNVAKRTVSDGSIAQGSTMLTSATALFTQADVGRLISISGAASGGATLNSQIFKVIDPQTVITNIPATLTMAGNATLVLSGMRTVSDCAISANQTTLTSASANFTINDIGGFVTIASAGIGSTPLVAQILYVASTTSCTISTPATNTIGAGTCIIAPSGPLAGTIVSVQSSTQCTLSDAASIACSGQQVGIATDDTAAVQATFAAATPGGKIVFPPAVYVVNFAGIVQVYGVVPYGILMTTSNIRIEGHGATLMVAGGNVRSFCAFLVGDNVNPVTNVMVSGLTFDGNAKAGRSAASAIGIGNQVVVPSQVGTAAMWGADEFCGGVLIQGPYTSKAFFPKVGQLFTRYITFRDCTFLRWTNAAFEAYSYADNITLENSVLDGGGVWANRLHMDGCRNSIIRGNTFRNLVGTSVASVALELLYNGDTGLRPSYGNTVENNFIGMTQAGMGGMALIGSYCRVTGNTVQLCNGAALTLSYYAGNNEYAGCTYNVIDGNRFVDNTSGTNIDGLRGTTRSGNASIGAGSSNLGGWTGTAFTTADIGCWVSIAGAAVGGGTLVSQIVSVTNGTTAVIGTTSAATTGTTAVTIGGQAGCIGSHNIIANNHYFNDATVTKTCLNITGVTNPVSYGAGSSWSAMGVAMDNASGLAVPAGGNIYRGNRVSGSGQFVLRDNSIGTTLPSQAGAGQMLYNAYIDNDFRSETLTPNRVSILSAGVMWDNYTPTGRSTGHIGGNGANIFGTPYKMLQSVLSTTWTPGAITNGTAVTTTVTVTGAAVGDTVAAQYTLAAGLPAGLLLTAWVSAANTVSLSFFNASAAPITPTAATVRVDWTGH